MPRKQRPGKDQRSIGWELETLHPLYDILTLHSGNIRADSIHRGVRIRGMEDARQAWEANREIFMQMCTCHRDKPCCRQHDYAYSPGERPWAFWVFDMGYEGTPDDQLAELKRLGMLTKEEIEALKPRPETAEIRKFPPKSEEE